MQNLDFPIYLTEVIDRIYMDFRASIIGGNFNTRDQVELK